MTTQVAGRRNGARKLPFLNPALAARWFVGAVCAVSETAGGLCAELAFRTPPRFKPTRQEIERLGRAARSFVRGSRGEIALWHWGNGPRVLLAHGWGSHAGRLTAFVPELLAAGFGVTAFDAPGHGQSAGRFASLPEFVEAVDLIARAISPVALVGHSLGAAACVLALKSGTRSRAVVLLSPPADPGAYTRRWARWMRLRPKAVDAMRRQLERRYGSALDDYRLAASAPAVPTLIVHDRGDTRVPVANARALAQSWPDARVVETRGLGHHRILRNREVRRLVAQFLVVAALGAREAHRVSPAHRLETSAVRRARGAARVARFLKPGVMAQSRA
ncbi:MAG TPA: alpha/beta fold hydrolase [Thermoanaerobaculia bacterium]|nr:alpha/beta fold hydrolase [Thermoanaerobaculia bacterium]